MLFTPEAQRLISFADEAMAVAKRESGNILPNKSPSQALTAADNAISALAQASFTDGILLDEESIGNLPNTLTQSQVLSHERLWVVDPIDGTAAFAADTSYWGITAGLWSNGQAIAGINVYPDWIGKTPEGKLLQGLQLAAFEKRCFINYGNQGWASYPFPKLTSNAFITLASQCHQEGWQVPEGYFPFDMHSCVWQFLNTFMGTSRATIFTGKPWDAAGSLAIAEALGLELINLRTGAPFKGFHEETLLESWRLKDFFLLVRPEEKELLLKILQG